MRAGRPGATRPEASQRLTHPELSGHLPQAERAPQGEGVLPPALWVPRRQEKKDKESGAGTCPALQPGTLPDAVRPGVPSEGVGPPACQHVGPGITAFESPREGVKCMFPGPNPWKETLWSPDLALRLAQS